MKLTPYRRHRGSGAPPIALRPDATVISRAWRRAGTTRVTSATTTPMTSAAIDPSRPWRHEVPRYQWWNIHRLVSVASPSPAIPPQIPTTAASVHASVINVRVVAPRTRSSALSRRRRAAPDAANDAL